MGKATVFIVYFVDARKTNKSHIYEQEGKQ